MEINLAELSAKTSKSEVELAVMLIKGWILKEEATSKPITAVIYKDEDNG